MTFTQKLTKCQKVMSRPLNKDLCALILCIARHGIVAFIRKAELTVFYRSEKMDGLCLSAVGACRQTMMIPFKRAILSYNCILEWVL